MRFNVAPEQMGELLLAVAVGKGLITTAVVAVFVQLLELVTVTV
jgi:hypothetical protein